MITAVREFGVGVGMLARGFRLVLSSGSMLVKGAVPALLSSLLLFGGILALLLNLGDLVSWMTPFADDWGWLGSAVRIGLGIAVVGLGVLVSMRIFAAVTLMIGGPFYESIAEEVEDKELGGVPEAQDLGWAKSAWMGLRDGVLLMARALVWGVLLFALGFVPVLGQTVVPVLAVFVGGWLLAIEMTAIPFVRRGRDLKQRRAELRKQRAATLGLGVPTYLLCLIPLAALLVFPAAMAGGTLLAHRTITGHRAA